MSRVLSSGAASRNPGKSETPFCGPLPFRGSHRTRHVLQHQKDRGSPSPRGPIPGRGQDPFPPPATPMTVMRPGPTRRRGRHRCVPAQRHPPEGPELDQGGRGSRVLHPGDPGQAAADEDRGGESEGSGRTGRATAGGVGTGTGSGLLTWLLEERRLLNARTAELALRYIRWIPRPTPRGRESKGVLQREDAIRGRAQRQVTASNYFMRVCLNALLNSGLPNGADMTEAEASGPRTRSAMSLPVDLLQMITFKGRSRRR